MTIRYKHIFQGVENGKGDGNFLQHFVSLKKEIKSENFHLRSDIFIEFRFLAKLLNLKVSPRFEQFLEGLYCYQNSEKIVISNFFQDQNKEKSS